MKPLTLLRKPAIPAPKKPQVVEEVVELERHPDPREPDHVTWECSCGATTEIYVDHAPKYDYAQLRGNDVSEPSMSELTNLFTCSGCNKVLFSRHYWMVQVVRKGPVQRGRVQPEIMPKRPK